MDVESMTVSELKKELKSRGLKVTGKKALLKSRLSEALVADAVSATDSAQHDDPDAHQQQTDFADFENYINDEYNKINAQNNGDASHDEAHSVNIDETVDAAAAATAAAVAGDVHEDEEKQLMYGTDFDLNAPTDATPGVTLSEDKPAPVSPAVTAPDFDEDEQALNSRAKVQSRRERFGNAELDEAAKLESRKRRFAAMAAADGVELEGAADGANKKARVDPEVERQRILERSQKFGTKLPANFKLTSEEAALVHAEQIKRAERFGTQHLLPTEIKRAEFEAKRAERMKRFQTQPSGAAKADGPGAAGKASSGRIIAATPEKAGSTKLAERRLRFGTVAASNEAVQKQPQGAKGKKLGPNRKDRNQKKFEQFRQYKRDNARGRGGRGRGRGGGRGGGRNRNRSRSRGRGGANRRNGGDGNNGNSNQHQQGAQMQFSAADRAKIEERKLRFSGM